MTGSDLRMLREQLLIGRNQLAREAGVTGATVQSAQRSLKLNHKTETRYLAALGAIAKRQAAERHREAVATMLASVDKTLLDLSSIV